MIDLQLSASPPILHEILKENNRQLEKWGIQDHYGTEWLAILTEEVGELAKAILEHDRGLCTSKDVMKEAVQVSTVAIKIAEMYRSFHIA